MMDRGVGSPPPTETDDDLARRIQGLKLPDWKEITRRDYAPWPEADLRLDTARLTAVEAAQAIVNEVTWGWGRSCLSRSQ